MSRFIPAGESDLKSLQAKESEASKKFLNEQEEKETLSLYDQMKLNHIAKEREFEEKVKSKNQSHILNEREIRFYKELEDKKKAKLESKKQEIENGLRIFEQSKKNKIAKPQPIKTISLDVVAKSIKKNPLLGNIVIKKKPAKTGEALPDKAQEPTCGIVGGYSSSSDSE